MFPPEHRFDPKTHKFNDALQRFLSVALSVALLSATLCLLIVLARILLAGN